jgi:two-component system, cell cycle sensor histidine kinase and response regulator CckA
MEPNNQWYDYVELIESSSRRGGALTQQLLTFARQKNVNYHPVEVNDVIRDTIRLMERSLDKSIRLHPLLTEDPTMIEGDERQLQQVLMNLILNARDAILQGGTIKLSTKVEYLNQERIFTPHGNEGHYICLRVEDNGTGMDKETMEKIFEPFFTTKDTGKGTGLGLSVVYGIVNKHKGFIIVDSHPGIGTIFNIHLPQLQHEKVKSVRGKWKSEKVTGGTENIIVIEDDALVGRMIRDMLTNLGYSVKWCVDGEEGLRELRNKNHRYDLLILDLNMPHISGRDVMMDLRKFNRTIPVIISTGYGEHVLDEQKIRGEIQAYIKKPYDEFEFGGLVRRVLDKHKQPTLQ